MTVAALYQFAEMDEDEAHRIVREMRDVMSKYDVRGNVRVAREGVNGTICGDRIGVEKFLDVVKGIKAKRRNELIYKEAVAKTHVYEKAIVKYKEEIVSIGPDAVKDALPLKRIGTYVKPEDWNERVVHDPDTIILDVRNDYEIQMGTFKGAVNPKTDTFNDFTKFVRTELPKKVSKDAKVAMFCTGGVRCEKASSLLLSEGYKDVYHLKGGILQYLQDVPKKNSTYQGECYVFDKRVSVDHDLKRGSYAQCAVCRKYVLEKSLQNDFCCEACLDSPKALELMEKKRKSDIDAERWKKAQAKKKNKKKAFAGGTKERKVDEQKIL